MAITHPYVSTVADGGDTDLVQPSNWNADHTGTWDAADLTYTPTTLTDWNSDTDPGNGDDALDQLAERVDDNEIAIATKVSILEVQVFS